MDESPYLKYCLKKVEEKLEWGNYSQWTDSDFKNLSQIIQDSSGILVSSHTLKRLFGKIYYRSDYHPQLATKDALAIYVGYESWKELKSAVSGEVTNKDKVLNSESPAKKSSFRRLRRTDYYVFSGLLLLLFAAFIIFFVKAETDYAFEVQNSIGMAPHTATFVYDFSSMGKENVFIDFDHFSNGGVYLMNKLNKNNGRVSRCFHIPGKYDIKLFVDNRIVQTAPVLVKSDDWFFYAIEPTPSYSNLPDIIKPTVTKRYYEIKFDNILAGDFINDGYMHIPHSSVTTIEGLSLNYKTHHVLVRPFSVSLDNCIFEINFRNEQFGEGVRCYEASFEIIGMNGSIEFQIVEPGCLNYAFLRIGKSFRFGETENLKDFEMEFLDFRTLKVITGNGEVIFFKEDTEFHREKYSESLGEVVGLHLSSKGTPHYDWIKIHDLEGNAIYEDDFDD